MPLLLAFTGKAGAGKSTAAEWYVKEHRFFPESFAERPKVAMQNLFGLEHSQVFGNKEQKEAVIPSLSRHRHISGRLLLQTFCTEWARETISPDVWVWPVEKKWETMKNIPGFKGMVISDLRFDNEAKWVKSQGGIIIEITEVKNGEESKWSSDDAMEKHVSESGISMDLIDATVGNGKTTKEFFWSSVAQNVDLALYNRGMDEKSPHYPPIRHDLLADNKPVFKADGVWVKGQIGLGVIETKPVRQLVVEWADRVFPNRTISNALQKMVMHEIPEYLMKQDDELELADLGILLYDIAHLAGFDLDAAIRKKMAINEGREWEIDTNTGLMSHVKEKKFVDLRDIGSFGANGLVLEE